MCSQIVQQEIKEDPNLLTLHKDHRILAAEYVIFENIQRMREKLVEDLDTIDQTKINKNNVKELTPILRNFADLKWIVEEDDKYVNHVSVKNHEFFNADVKKEENMVCVKNKHIFGVVQMSP